MTAQDNHFVGGSMDGLVIKTENLLDNAAYVKTLPIEDYEMTEGDADSEHRTWTFRDDVIESTAEYEPDETIVVGADATQTSDEQPAAQSTTEEGFRAWRERLGLSRGPVAEASGLTVAKVARIETKGGDNTEEHAVREALQKLEKTRA